MTWGVGSGANSNDRKKAWCPWCSYVTVNFAMAAWNKTPMVFISFPFIRKQIFKKMTKNYIFIVFLFNPGAVVELNHCMTYIC
jgi:hypothetical protein